MKQMLQTHNLPDQGLVMDNDSDSRAAFVIAVEGINSDVVIRSSKSKEFDGSIRSLQELGGCLSNVRSFNFLTQSKLGDRLC